MSAPDPSIAAIGAITPADRWSAVPAQAPLAQVQGVSFVDMLADGVGRVEAKVARANELANAFVLDDSIPVHQVTFALEEARLSLELAMQIRTRVTDAYQQLMGMQL